METVKLLIVDDHPLFREGLKSILRRDPAYVAAGEAGTAAEALKLAASREFDLAVVDITLPDKSGVDLAADLKKIRPDMGVLMLSMHTRADYIVQSFRNGAGGYLTKDSAADKLLEGLASVRAGSMFLDPAVSDEVAQSLLRFPGEKDKGESAYESLTSREREVMRHVVAGLTTKQIAEILDISGRTVEHHRSSIMKKFGVRNTPQLIRCAAQLGLID